MTFLLLWRWLAGHWRWIVIGLCVVAISWLVAEVNGWREDAAELPQAKQEAADALARLARFQIDMKAELARRATLEEALRHEADELRRVRAATPTRVVRLCPAAEALPGTGGTSTSGGDNAPPSGAGQLPQATGPGPDIGAALYEIADDADWAVRNARALQQWVAGLPPACRGE